VVEYGQEFEDSNPYAQENENLNDSDYAEEQDAGV
jgi:hypothetical protein